MACRLTDAKPLSKPMLDYCSLDSGEEISMKFQNTTIYIEETDIEYVVWKRAAILSRPQCGKSPNWFSITNTSKHNDA